MKTKMQLKNIIRFLYALDHVKIYQEDVYISGPCGKPEEIFEGSIIDIPWYIMDFYLYNDSESEAITISHSADATGFEIYVVEDPKYATEVII